MSCPASPIASDATFLQYGGQAVIEGVMMRSPHYFAVACRRPNGEIVVKCEPADSGFLQRLRWLNRPFLRGTLALLDAMILGTRALAYSSSVQIESENAIRLKTDGVDAIIDDNGSHTEEHALPPNRVASTSPINDIAIGGTIAVSFVLGICVFVLLPTLITDAARAIGLIRHGTAYTALNLVDGLVRMAIFFGYIGLVSLMPQIRRVFMYHGAEHKAINALEAGAGLSESAAFKASRFHPRCGTSFIFIVLVINMVAFIFLPRPVWYLRFPLHLCMIPFVAGVAYEAIKFAGRYRRYPIVRALFAPGIWSQYLTTREPMAEQICVALAALESVLRAEGLLPIASIAPNAIVEDASPAVLA